MQFIDLLLLASQERATLPRWNGQTISVRRQKLGDLSLPSGRVIAIDPVHWGAPWMAGSAFSFSVPPGSYPVYASVFDLDEYPCVALVYAVFSANAVDRWKMATRPGENLATLDDDEFFGFGVDAGVGSYLSPEAAAFLQEHPEAVDFPYAGVGGETRIDDSLNAVYFRTGGGDGHYPSYVTWDSSGDVVSLTTDFGIIDLEVDFNRLGNPG